MLRPVTTVTSAEPLQVNDVTHPTMDETAVTSTVTPPTSDNASDVTHVTDVTPDCTECGTQLLPSNNTGLCAECTHIARQRVIAARLNGAP